MSESESKNLTFEAFVVNDGYEDEETDVEAARNAVLDGGARYRGGTAQADAGEQMDVDHSHCQGCGAAVSMHVRRVLGDSDNIAWACFDCANGSQMKRGAAASEDCDGTVADGLTQGGAL